MPDDTAARPPWMPSDFPDGSQPPAWDQDEADGLVGLLVLAGITYLAPGGESVKSQVQCWGRIVSATPKGLTIACEGKTWSGQTMMLPPDLSVFQAANPGRYTLRSTGESIENPDLTTSWTITNEEKS